MKRQFLTCLFALIFMAGNLNAQEQGIIKVGDMAPEFTIVSDNGNQMKSVAFKGKVVLVNLFATWCPPCQKELAEVQATLWPKYQNNKDFVMLTIGREHTDAELAAYNEKKGFTFPLYPDKGRVIFDAFAKSLIPRSYLIGKDGKVIYSTVGFEEEDFSTLLRKIEAALK